jgi:hypothetical protein
MYFARNTQFLLYNGDIKYITDLKIGDYLMGDDSTKRKILNINNSTSILYKVSTSKGDSYYVSDNHILLLKKDGSLNTVEIKLKDYLNMSDKELWFGYQKMVNFKEIDPPNDPYLYGLSLSGDNLIIQKEYKCNSYNNRKKLLDGIIDNQLLTTRVNDKSIKIKYSDDINYLILSLAFYSISINNCIYLSLDYNDLYHSINVRKIGKDFSTQLIIDGNQKIFLSNFIVVKV